MPGRYLQDLDARISATLDDLASKTNTVTLNLDFLAGVGEKLPAEDRQSFEDARAAAQRMADLVRELQRLLG